MEVGKMNGYRDTKKGALIGAAITSACGAATVGINSYLLKHQSDIKSKVKNDEKKYHSVMHMLKIQKDTFTSPRTIVKGLAIGVVAGAAIGLVVDVIKGRIAKKAEEV